jgi:hypothetical protein
VDRSHEGHLRLDQPERNEFLSGDSPSAFFEAILGYNLDYKSNADMGLAIGLCAALVYLLGAGLGFLYSRISS